MPKSVPGSQSSPAPPSIFDRWELPPTSKMLGWTLLAIDRHAQTVEVGFTVGPEFANPGGTIQGGFIAAMLDDTQGTAVFGTSDGRHYAPTVDFHVTFVNPARPGAFIAKGRVIKLGKTIVLTEADLFDGLGQLVANGRFVSRLMSGSSVAGS